MILVDSARSFNLNRWTRSMPYLEAIWEIVSRGRHDDSSPLLTAYMNYYNTQTNQQDQCPGEEADEQPAEETFKYASQTSGIEVR